MKQAIEAILASQHPVIVQAENPDGDSLASALALESILGAIHKEPELFCSVEIPKYLRYLPGWDRVKDEWPKVSDLIIIVDTSSKSLLQRLVDDRSADLKKKPVLVIDHHSSESDLEFDAIELIQPEAVSTGEVIANLSEEAGWNIDEVAAQMIASSILSDSLGLSSPKTSASSIHILASMVESGANLSQLDDKRREFNRKSLDIFKYKGRLFERVELALDGKLAMVSIPWEEIEQYSDAYNPSMLIIDEMRLIEGVDFAVAFKSYPDGKITAKLRANPSARFMDDLAATFGGGGHPFAAGFKVFGATLDEVKSQLVTESSKLLEIE